MKLTPSLTAAIAVVLSASASAQFVKGNEAVAGQRVETAPVLASQGRPCSPADKCHAGAWHMVETTSGLVECTEPSARPTTCRASTYAKQRLPRLWVVKRGGTWLWCQYPDLASKCVDMSARPPANLPYDAVQ